MPISGSLCLRWGDSPPPMGMLPSFCLAAASSGAAGSGAESAAPWREACSSHPGLFGSSAKAVTRSGEARRNEARRAYLVSWCAAGPVRWPRRAPCGYAFLEVAAAGCRRCISSRSSR
jgi:hypothetical protein